MSIALLWSYSPILLGPAAAIGLAWLLQRLLRYSRKQPPAAAPSTGTALVLAAPKPAEKVTWADITAERNGFVTTVVPVFASGAILLLGIWPFATSAGPSSNSIRIRAGAPKFRRGSATSGTSWVLVSPDL